METFEADVNPDLMNRNNNGEHSNSTTTEQPPPAPSPPVIDLNTYGNFCIKLIMLNVIAREGDLNDHPVCSLLEIILF